MKGKSGVCGIGVCENLKLCIMTRPPLVLFTIGLCCLGVAFVSLAIYVQDTDLIADPNYISVSMSSI